MAALSRGDGCIIRGCKQAAGGLVDLAMRVYLRSRDAEVLTKALQKFAKRDSLICALGVPRIAHHDDADA